MIFDLLDVGNDAFVVLDAHSNGESGPTHFSPNYGFSASKLAGIGTHY